MGAERSHESLTPPEAGAARAAREVAALFSIAERHAATPERRARALHPDLLDPYEAVRLVTALAGGALAPEPGEPALEDPDVTAALSLVPRLRAEVDALELALLTAARGRGATWQSLAFGLGLGSAQAAQQRFDRLSDRTRRESPE